MRVSNKVKPIHFIHEMSKIENLTISELHDFVTELNPPGSMMTVHAKTIVAMLDKYADLKAAGKLLKDIPRRGVVSEIIVRFKAIVQYFVNHDANLARFAMRECAVNREADAGSDNSDQGGGNNDQQNRSAAMAACMPAS